MSEYKANLLPQRWAVNRRERLQRDPPSPKAKSLFRVVTKTLIFAAGIALALASGTAKNSHSRVTAFVGNLGGDTYNLRPTGDPQFPKF